ncbi:MAG: Gfo/Idh/MocA family oxidoreductase [Candidatus Hydrogenedentes bacterium]|nr:Gfo/Idh/MocA family oxidoreductase [Candidatus Hydrogenedentota bacterium]
MKDQHLTRRAFLAATTTTALAATFPIRVNAAEVVPGKKSPNEKLNVAAIGAGGKGQSDIMSCSRTENIVALCDADWDRAQETFYRLKDAKQFKDYREMLEKMPEIDACTISTPDHTHAPAAYMAMKLGKHVYVQKPLTHTVMEARLLRKTAKEMGVATQMGNQGHCGDGARDLCEMVWSGAIGQVKEAHIWTNRPVWPQGIAQPLPKMDIPATMDWDLWIGTAPMRDYNKDYCPFNWRGWWDYGCGALGDMACHIMDPAFWALNLKDAASYSVECIQQDGKNDQTAPNSSIIKYSFPARGDMAPVDVFWYDGGILPKRPEAIPADQKLGDGDNGSLFVGDKGFLTAGEYGGKARLMPDAVMTDYKKPAQTIKRIEKESPYIDWLQACKGGEAAASNFEYSGPFTEMVVFGNLSLRTSVKVEWDALKGEMTNAPEWKHLLTKQYRAGWELPV